MSQSTEAPLSVTTGESIEAVRSLETGTTEEVLDALGDPDCLAILEATASAAHSASEIGETCGLPLSTAYRKIDQLTDAGLLAERLRIRQSGKHYHEYRRAVDDVVVSFDGPAGISCSITGEAAEPPAYGVPEGR